MTDEISPDLADARCTGVENGRKIAFELSATGQAGVTVSGGVTSLAFAPGRTRKLPIVGSTIQIEGENYTVQTVKELKALKLVRLALVPAAEAEG